MLVDENVLLNLVILASRSILTDGVTEVNKKVMPLCAADDIGAPL